MKTDRLIVLSGGEKHWNLQPARWQNFTKVNLHFCYPLGCKSIFCESLTYKVEFYTLEYA